MKKYLFVSLVCCLLFTSCNDGVVFKKTINIEKSAWEYGDILEFDFEIADTSKQYDLLLDVEHTGDYGFQNLYVQFRTKYPSGEEKQQLVSLELASQTGIWNGKCSGNSCTVQIPLQANAIFQEPGQHQISIEQFMRKSPLLGMVGMTLKVKESEVK